MISEFETFCAVDFLTKFDPDGWHNLVAIDPETRAVDGRTFPPGSTSAMTAWVEARNGKANLYFSVNEPRPHAPHTKLKKTDIAAVRALFTDVDPEEGDLDAERKRLSRLALESDASVILDSGGGVQMFWRLEDKVSTADGFEWAEGCNRRIAADFGGDHTWDVNRIMRLPFTMNLPDAKKRSKGRVPALATVLRADGRRWARTAIETAFPPLPVAQNATDNDAEVQATIAAIKATDFDGYGDFEDLPAELRRRLNAALQADHGLRELWHGVDAGNEYRFHLATSLKAHGFGVEDYARLAHVWHRSTSKPDRPSARDLARDWTRSPTHVGAAEEFEGVDLGVTPPAREQRGRLKFLSYAEMKAMPEPQWLVDGVVQQRTAALLFGKSNTFKSFLAADIGLSVATGRTWHGRQSSRGRVLFVATEGANGMGRLRVPGWYDFHGVEEADRANAFLYPQEILLDQKDHATALIATCKAIGDFALIVFDIFGGTMAGTEVEDTTARAWVHNIQRIMRETGAATLTVAHTGWQDETRARMHTHFWGSFDSRMRADGDKDKRTTCLTIERHKDADSSGAWGFRLENAGETLVPVLDDSVKSDKGVGLAPSLKLALRALDEAIEEHGVLQFGEHWPDTKVVEVGLWRDACYRLGITSSDNPEARKKAFKRARDTLRERKLIDENEGHAWGIFA